MMTVIIEKIQQEEVLIADFGAVKLYRIVENNEENTLESANESEG
jgi:hypothetical protein